MTKDLYKLYNYFLLTLPVIICVFCSIIYYSSLREFQKDLLRSNFDKSRRISIRLSSNFTYMDKFSNLVASKISRLDHVNPKTIGDILEKTYLVAQLGDDITTYTKFDFVDPNGKVLANVSEGAFKETVLVKKNEREWMTLAPKEPWKLHISAVAARAIAPKNYSENIGIPAGFGITNTKGDFIGIISAGIDTDKLISKINFDFGDEDTHFLILGNNKELICSSDQNINKDNIEIFTKYLQNQNLQDLDLSSQNLQDQNLPNKKEEFEANTNKVPVKSIETTKDELSR
ncbi:MAG: hypothetical protein SFT93_03900, partial [Rickettsiaceae bacterium]|nr:hypothetical protein [Rickettsiaceae bacterium]